LFKDELMKNPEVLGVSLRDMCCSFAAVKVNNDSIISFASETVDENYVPLLKIQVLKGRNFSTNFPSDSSHAVLINESFAKKAGWEDPIGKEVNFWNHNNKKCTIVGLVNDYHFQSLDHEIGPQLFTLNSGTNYGMAYIKIKPNSATTSLPFIERNFKKLFPASPYSYQFKDQENLKDYELVAKWKQIMLLGAVLTIFISCIGLFGLSALSAERRTKEIGIRKVLGASVTRVMSIMSKDFLFLVLIAMAIAMPIGWMSANKWLQSYPYRVQLGWELLVDAGLLVIVIASLTVGFQAIKVARANPAKSLRAD
jgi:putative ABC transport system permease protein